MAKKQFSKFTDEELLVSHRQSGELSYLGELYQRYIPLVYGLCLKYLANVEAAQDAVMDIYEIVVKKFDESDVKNFKAWLYTVSKNHCLYCIKKNKRENWVDFDEDIMENEASFTLFDGEQSEAEMKALEYCMQQLSEEQQISIQYFYLNENSYLDIVEKTGYPLSKVKSYIQNGKRNLKICIINIVEKGALS